MFNPCAFLAAALLAALALPAAADTQIHYRIRGLTPSASPAPPCVDPASLAPGEASTRLCGHEGVDLMRVSTTGFLLERQPTERARWEASCAGAEHELAPGNIMHEAMRLAPEVFSLYTWYWISSTYGIAQMQPSGIVASSQDRPEAEHQAYCVRRY